MTVFISSRFILFQREGLSFSNWDKWVVKGTQDFKLKSFLKYFKVSAQLWWMRIVLCDSWGDLLVTSTRLLCIPMCYLLQLKLHMTMTSLLQVYRTNFKMLVKDARVSVSARHVYIFIKINEKNAYNSWTLNSEFRGYPKEKMTRGPFLKAPGNYRAR